MSPTFRLPAALSATVTAALVGALLAAPTTAFAESYAAPSASHVKTCKQVGFAGAPRMRLQSSTKATGRSGKIKVTARAWVYTNQSKQACVVTSAKSPKVKKTRKTTSVTYSGYSSVESDSAIKFEEGHQFNLDDRWGHTNNFGLWGGKAPQKISATVIDLTEELVMTAEEMKDFPEAMHTLEGKRYRIDATSLDAHWELEGRRTLKTKKVSKAKADKVRKSKVKKINARRTADLKKARTTRQAWVAAQPQTTTEERTWVKFYGDLIHDLDKMLINEGAKSEKSVARQAAKDAVRGSKTVSAYRIKIDLPLTLP